MLFDIPLHWKWLSFIWCVILCCWVSVVTDGDVIKNNWIRATHLRFDSATYILPEPLYLNKLKLKVNRHCIHWIKVVSRQRRKSTTKLKLYLKVKPFHLLMQCWNLMHFYLHTHTHAETHPRLKLMAKKEHCSNITRI